MSTALSTDRELAALKPRTARYERSVAQARGLSIIVYPNGCKTFVVRYAAPSGARRRLVIGDYPALSLAAARLQAAAHRLDVVGGGDPAAARMRARAEARSGESLAQLAEGYWKAAALGIHGGRKRPLRPLTIERQKGLWNTHIKPVLGACRYKDIRRADVREFMQGLVAAGKQSPASIACVGDVLRALFTYALHQDLVEANPTMGLTKPIAPEPRTRRFDAAALIELLGQLADAAAEDGRCDIHARLEPVMALALQFAILTLSRRTEAAGADWREVDLASRTWTIPGERTKNRKAHVVPLSDQAIAVLEAARRQSRSNGEGFVFPSPADPHRHLDPHALTRAVKRMCARRGLAHGSPHDFRRTGATILASERYGFRRFIIGKVLGHTSIHEGAAVTSVYDLYEYLAEKRQALDAWGRHIDGLTPPRNHGSPMTPQRRHLRLVSAA